MTESPTPNSGALRQRFSAQMREHHRELLVFAAAASGSRESAKDIVQESFVSAWKSFERFDESRDFGAWMRGIVRNKTKDWFRRQQRDPIFDMELLDREIGAWQTAKESGNSIFEIVTACVGKLPSNYQTAVQAFYFEDREGNEASESLNISPANLRKRLQRARALLHDCIASQTHPEKELQTENSHV